MQYDEALRKVRSLLNLAARGGTPEEAANAAAMAQKIIDKYNIDIEDADFDVNQAKADAEPITDFGWDDPLDKAKYGAYVERWSVRLANVVCNYNTCAIRYYRGESRESVIKIIGRPSDVAAVRYLYAYFKSQIIELTKTHTLGHSTAYKGQFADGCIDTLNRRLTEQRKSTFEEKRASLVGNSTALVRVEKAIARIDKRAEDVSEFLLDKINRNIQQYADALGISFEKARKEYFKGRRGFSGSSAGESGRSHGQKAGESIRLTGAKGALGSSRKAIE